MKSFANADAYLLLASPSVRVPSASGIKLPAKSALIVITSLLASPSVILPPSVKLPSTFKLPLISTLPVAPIVIRSVPSVSKRIVLSLLPSSTWICVLPSVSDILVILAEVVNLRTSIKSPVAGAVVNSSVTPSAFIP